MTSVTQIWAKTLDQFPLLENLVFILYNSFTSIPSFSSPSVWMVCSVSQRRRVWAEGGQMIGRRDAETRGSGIRGKPDSPCSGLLSALITRSRWPELWSRLLPEAQTDRQPALVIFCCCLCSHEPGWAVGRVFCDLIPPRSSVCVCVCVSSYLNEVHF